MVKELRPAIVMILLFTLITGLIYPFVVTGIAQVVFPHQAAGSLVVKDGKVVGSELMGQAFTGDNYFHGRPSATSAPDPNDPTKTVDAPYNAANTGGSNLGPTSKALIERMSKDVAQLKGTESECSDTDRSRHRLRQRA
jgi:potassium-transporting ATPase KdpC subunit